jgi:selenocysteine lyase/cysteine desulfurase
VASIDYLSTLDDEARGERPERLAVSMRSLAAYLADLMDKLIYELNFVPRINIVGDPSGGVPALAFTHDGRKAQDVAAYLADRGLCVVADMGDHGVLEHLGSGEVGGVVRVGLAHYTTASEIDQLARALTELV